MAKLSLLKSIFVLVVLCVLTAIASPAQTYTRLFGFNGYDGGNPGSLVQG